MGTDEYVYRCLTSIHGAVGTLHTCLLLSNFQQIHVQTPTSHTYCRVKHPNIVQLKELYDDKARLYLVMEL